MTEAGATPPVDPIALLDRHRLDRVRAAQLAMLEGHNLRDLPLVLCLTAVFWGTLAVIGHVTWPVAIGWTAAMAGHGALRVHIHRAYLRAAPEDWDWSRWARICCAGTGVGGLVTGFGMLALLKPGQLDQQAFFLLFLAGIGSVSVTTTAAYLPAFHAYFLPTMLPSIGWSLAQGDEIHYAFAGTTIIYILVTMGFARQFNDRIIESLRLRFENLELVDDLRRQKERAEQANIAKSRFLASASHDLRQPVHALGMFVGALRGRVMDIESRRLVEQIERSVSATDNLFGSLLDISRLDAGVIQVHPTAFPAYPLLDRICRDNAAEAEGKGVKLVLCPSSLAIDSDPVLVERILRNLVSNAVRYTDRGRVLVGCRRGPRVRVEIWDTGRGIPPAHQIEVFQEFYQLDNPERDRAKGLGLGLAIVKRLTALLGCPLSLRSAVGRGSVFKVEFPRAASDAALPMSAPEPASALAGAGLVLVLDDEAAIRDAMRSLLESWGYAVIAAGSCAEMRAQIVTCPTRPCLIISDYRLRGEEHGIAAIEELQSEYNDDIPAMLITGDTAPDRLKEAQASGYLLLHKPVGNARLRAAIASLTEGPIAISA
jgi:two-component system, sensor histidine kinase